MNPQCSIVFLRKIVLHALPSRRKEPTGGGEKGDKLD